MPESQRRPENPRGQRMPFLVGEEFKVGIEFEEDGGVLEMAGEG